MTKQELDEMFGKAKLISYDNARAWYETDEATLWWCNPDYEWISPEDLDPLDTMVRVVTMTVKEVEDWIGGWDIDFDEIAEYGWEHIDVARVEPRNN